MNPERKTETGSDFTTFFVKNKGTEDYNNKLHGDKA